MAQQADVLAYLAVSLPVIGVLGAAWLANRGGKKAADKNEFEPQEHGEHAHTRDVIKLQIERIIDKLDEIIRLAGEVRQEEQKIISTARLAETFKTSRSRGNDHSETDGGNSEGA